MITEPTCDDCMLWMADHACGALSDDAAARLDRHLRTCAACVDAFAGLLSADASVRAGGAGIATPHARGGGLAESEALLSQSELATLEQDRIGDEASGRVELRSTDAGAPERPTSTAGRTRLWILAILLAAIVAITFLVVRA